jgi:hypothetical protein
MLSLSSRKAGILLCRARHIPTDPESTLYRLTQPFFRELGLYYPNDDIRSILLDLTERPDVSSITLSLLLSAPYDPSVVSSIFSEMVYKEMTAMESEAKHSSVHWSSLLTPDLPLHTDYRPSPNTNRYFRGIIERWKARLSNVVILPHSSTKSLSRDTLRRFNDYTGNTFESINPVQLEQFYCETGVKLGGVCEMRQVWYPTNATPRTYYAMGGDAYYRSRYLRDIFNYLSDYLPATNRYTRVDPSHLSLESDEDTFIYDLTSFTSLFHEQRYFLDFLASVVDGVIVKVLDTHVGIVNVSLSDLILDYNLLNKQPEYSLERVGIDLVLRHSVAGFLGVYANLVTCTIPHGLALMTISDQKMKQWCAGDDGGTAYKTRDRSFMFDMPNMLDTLGKIQMEKTYRDNENDPAVALKRRLVRLPRLLTLLPNILFPPFSTLFGDDARFNRGESLSDTDRIAKFCSGLSSMMYQLSLSNWESGDVSFIRQVLPILYKRMGLPPEGWFPPLCGYDYAPYGITLSFSVPRLLGEFWRIDPTKALLDAYMPRFFSGNVLLDKNWDGFIEDEVECNSSGLLNMGVKMGFLERDTIRVTYQLEDDVRAAVYREFYQSDSVRKYVLYRYTKVMNLPVWLR